MGFFSFLCRIWQPNGNFGDPFVNISIEPIPAQNYSGGWEMSVFFLIKNWLGWQFSIKRSEQQLAKEWNKNGHLNLQKLINDYVNDFGLTMQCQREL